ncbi:unnamed protein product, partial [Candidula unifasciata]
ALTETDQHYITATHNRVRESNNRDPIEWDPFLQKWAEYVINCKVDYPGPVHAYSNFHRLDQGARVYTVVYDWSIEGNNTNVELDHGCRTPKDRTRCNHYTNIIQPTLTSMACAARDCKDNTRQLVCLYDNREDREARNPLSSFTSGSRRNRRTNKRKQNV